MACERILFDESRGFRTAVINMLRQSIGLHLIRHEIGIKIPVIDMAMMTGRQ